MTRLKFIFGTSLAVRPRSPLARESAKYLVALQSIRVTDAQDTEVLSATIQNGPGSKVIASNESKRPMEFIQVPIPAALT